MKIDASVFTPPKDVSKLLFDVYGFDIYQMYEKTNRISAHMIKDCEYFKSIYTKFSEEEIFKYLMNKKNEDSFDEDYVKKVTDQLLEKPLGRTENFQEREVNFRLYCIERMSGNNKNRELVIKKYSSINKVYFENLPIINPYYTTKEKIDASYHNSVNNFFDKDMEVNNMFGKFKPSNNEEYYIIKPNSTNYLNFNIKNFYTYLDYFFKSISDKNHKDIKYQLKLKVKSFRDQIIPKTTVQFESTIDRNEKILNIQMEQLNTKEFKNSLETGDLVGFLFKTRDQAKDTIQETDPYVGFINSLLDSYSTFIDNSEEKTSDWNYMSRFIDRLEDYKQGKRLYFDLDDLVRLDYLKENLFDHNKIVIMFDHYNQKIEKILYPLNLEIALEVFLPDFNHIEYMKYIRPHILNDYKNMEVSLNNRLNTIQLPYITLGKFLFHCYIQFEDICPNSLLNIYYREVCDKLNKKAHEQSNKLIGEKNDTL